MNKLLKEFLSYVLEARKKPQNTPPREPKHKVGDVWQPINPKTKQKSSTWSAKRAEGRNGTRGGFPTKAAAQAWLDGKGRVGGKEEPTPKKPEKIDRGLAVVRQVEKDRADAERAVRQRGVGTSGTGEEDPDPVATSRREATNDSRLGKLFNYLKNKVSQVSRMRALRAFEMTIETRLPDDKKEQAQRLVSKLEQLLEAHSNGDTKTAQRLVKELQDEFKFYSNAKGTSFKTKAFGMGERHFVGKSALAKDLVLIFDKYRPKGTPSIVEAEDQDGATKQELTAASKARQGEYVTRTNRKGEQVRVFVPDAVSAVDSPRVKRILAGISIEDRFKAIYGPTDENGDIIDNTGGKNSREYFRHSLERTVSLDETADTLERNGFPKMAQAVRDHKKRMEDILENWDSYTDEERELAVQQSYSDMAVRLHSTAYGGDSEMCGAIMKNLAEMSLYESELAGGKEVYLPASGSFPAADKLIRVGGGTKAERIDKISVKFGKNGKVYGMPAQSSTIGLMHPDSFYHEVTSGRVGIKGSETGVRSDALERDNWARLIEDSGYGQCFTSKTAAENVRKAFLQAQQVIAEERDKIRPQPPTNKTLALMMRTNKRVQEARTKIEEALSAGIDVAKLEEHGGPERVAMLRNPLAFASMMAMDASIISGNGFPDLLHAHMVMVDEDGDGTAEEMKTVVEPGDTNLRNWHYLWREADERGGGLLVGFAHPDESDEEGAGEELPKKPRTARGR